MPVFVDHDEVVRSAVEGVVTRCLPDADDLEPAERAAIEADAARRGITFTAAHALRRHAARATLTRIASARAVVAIADAAIAAGHALDAREYRTRDRRGSVPQDLTA